jgi:hypothetical protein
MVKPDTTTNCIIEHWRDGECIERWDVTDDMIQKDGDMARIIFPVGQIVLTSYDELHFCITDSLELLSEVQQRR